MGGGVQSRLLDCGPENENIDFNEFKDIAGRYYSWELYDAMKDEETGLVPISRVSQLLSKTDVYLSYDWGNDDEGRCNRERMFRVNDWLRHSGRLITWSHTKNISRRATSEVEEQSLAAIDNTSVFLAFITRNYLRRVGAAEGVRDLCQRECRHAYLHKTPERMLIVVMDPSCLDPSEWPQPLRAVAAAKPIIDLSSDDRDMHLENSLMELLSHITDIAEPILKTVERAATGSKEPNRPTSNAIARAAVRSNTNFNLNNYIEAITTPKHIPGEVVESQIISRPHSPGDRGYLLGVTANAHAEYTPNPEDELAALPGPASLLLPSPTKPMDLRATNQWLATNNKKINTLTEAEALDRIRTVIKIAKGDTSRRARLGVPACEGVTEAMSAYPNNREITLEGCIALKVLAFSRNAHKAALGKAAVPVILRVLSDHIDNEEIVEKATLTLVHYAKEDATNRKRLGSAGACPLLMKIVGMFCMSNKQVAENVCAAMWHMCVDCQENKSLFGKQGCNAVVDMMKAHVDCPAVAHEGCGAISHLAEGHAGNKAVLGKNGGCEAILTALTRHPTNTFIAHMGCRACSSLTKAHAQNKLKFAELDAGVIICEVIMRHIDLQTVSQEGSLAIHNLASIDEIAVKLGEIDACEVIVKVIHKHAQNHHVMREAIKSAMRLRAGGGTLNATRLMLAGFVQLAVEAEEERSGLPEDVRSWASKAIALCESFVPDAKPAAVGEDDINALLE